MMEDMRELLTAHPEFKSKLFCRGFLLTDADIDEEAYPFYGLWNSYRVLNKTLLVHPEQHAFIQQTDTNTMILIGHAYNPFTMEPDEDIILKKLAQYLTDDVQNFWNYLNQCTGVFTLIWITQNSTRIIGDPSGMQTAFYTAAEAKLYVSSHTMLLNSILHLSYHSYISRLVHYRFFKLLGNSLPGDLTQFSDVRRIVPNHMCCYHDGIFTNRRFFWPAENHALSYDEIVLQASDILHRSLELISRKWSRPAISLTGGCDSKTTLACANGLYNRFQYFSYSSSDAERLDAQAAHSICNALNLSHDIYEIPTSPEEFDIASKILLWNCGNLLESHENDVRKRIFLADHGNFDVEVKSWASEIGRAYYSKRFHGRTNFPAQPNGRACTTLYKFFLHNRKLVRETDQAFDAYLRQFYDCAKQNPIPWFEQFFWEFRVPSWNGLVITGEHRYSSDITVPYNNRSLLILLLSVPIEKRIRDQLYTDIRMLMKPEIDQTGIAVVNMKHTRRRAYCEDLYWNIHSRLPI